ncbi:hypothetical protein P5673_032867 [Acropora cervicornis]|uniref:Uncharacterized protein n=1 Tax=Acropora cervicornis TaxID=6130 RepID=A0AAD9PQS4_ACRCE|nr:hypothetical protein P5673_032867 [Acropora cervicornis]
MHTVPNHVPIVVKQNSTMKQFTGQGVEKNNDAKRLLFQKSNNQEKLVHMRSRQDMGLKFIDYATVCGVV